MYSMKEKNKMKHEQKNVCVSNNKYNFHEPKKSWKINSRTDF